jgi:magnesium transporter
MLRYYVKKSFNEEPQEVKQPFGDHVWVYGSEVTPAELSQLAEEYKLDHGVLRDIFDRQELPRIEYTSGILYVFLRTPHRTSHGEIMSVPFLSVIKNGSLMTLSSKSYLTPNDLFENVRFSMRSNKHVFLQIAAYVIGQYENYIQQTGSYIHGTKRRLETHEVDNRDFVKFVTVESDLNEYTTNLTAIQAVLGRLHDNKHQTFTEKDCEYIEDIILHVNQLLVSVSSHTHAISSIRNAYTTMSNNTLNRRMKTLTLLTLLVALPNVFYGMFGMNVRLPFADEPWAYGAITLFTLIIVTVVYVIVRRMRF